MVDLCRLIFGIASDLLRSQVALEAEILVIRHQINVLRRANPKRVRFVSIDRLILGGVCQLFPKMYGTGRDGRDTPAYPPDERRQSVVGSTEDPWRASQAWHRCRPD